MTGAAWLGAGAAEDEGELPASADSTRGASVHPARIIAPAVMSRTGRRTRSPESLGVKQPARTVLSRGSFRVFNTSPVGRFVTKPCPHDTANPLRAAVAAFRGFVVSRESTGDDQVPSVMTRLTPLSG